MIELLTNAPDWAVAIVLLLTGVGAFIVGLSAEARRWAEWFDRRRKALETSEPSAAP